ncbi:MAG: trimethylamine methyltransferase family protein [Acidobacteria bacterium]|nr:trimethylamine methyltransferase family protein [Acidobacteriota bacterium]
MIDAADIQSIHDASLKLLTDIGVSFTDSESLEFLARAGADVDRATQAARIPDRLVHETLDRCGKQYFLHGRAAERRVRFGAGEFILVSSPGQFAWIEEDGTVRREPALADTRLADRIGDALEEINIVGGMGMALDIPAHCRDVFMAAELVKGTSKVTQVWISGGDRRASFWRCARRCAAARRRTAGSLCCTALSSR